MKRRLAVFHMLPSGGGIRVAGQFARGLAGEYSLDVHRPRGSGSFTPSGNIRERVYPYPMWKRPSGLLRPVAPVFLAARLLSFRKVCRGIAESINRTADIALVHNTMPVAAPPVLEYLTVPSLYFCYEYPRHIYEKDIIRRTGSPAGELALKPLEALEKRMDISSAASADRIATFSSYMRKRIQDIYSRDSAVVPPGVDTEFFSPGAAGEARDKHVFSVGALWPFKGHETSIRILSLIPEGIRPQLIIAADREFPGHGDTLKAVAERLSVKISIRRGISNIELRELYRTAAAVLCCQRREPYGLVPLEAMACGTPVVAVSEGGFLDNIVHGETGYLFDGTPEQGALALSGVIAGNTGNMTGGALDFVREKRNLMSGIHRLIEVIEDIR